jgi:hypothetical protein
VTPKRTSSPAPISPTISPAMTTLARLTRCTTARMDVPQAKSKTEKVESHRRCFLLSIFPFTFTFMKPKRDYSAHQHKIIKRYYDNLDTIALQRLANLVGELYLAEGKKKEKAWQAAAAAMQKLKVPAPRIEQLLKQQKPALLAELVQELQSGK